MTFDFLTAAGLTAAASAVLTFLVIIIPPLRTWFGNLDADTQVAVRGITIIVVALLFVLGSCFGVFAGLPCTASDIGGYALSVVFSAVLGLGMSNGLFAARRFVKARQYASSGYASAVGKSDTQKLLVP